MTTAVTSASALADQVWARLRTLATVNVFDGEVDPNPPADADGRVHAYAVFYPSPGWARALLADGGGDTLDWSFQVTSVGGDRTRALWCIDQVRGVLDGFHVTNAAGQQLIVSEAGDPGPLLRDDDVSPARFYSPLRFTVFA